MGKLMFMRMNIVEAIPMTRKEYVESRGWTLPADENPDDEVYKVVYSDGYVSMCPKDKFDAVSVSCAEGCVPFGYAIAQCQFFGKKIKRAGWNGDGQYVRFETVLQFPDGKPKEGLADGEKQTAEESSCFVFHFKNRHTGETGVQVGWLASQADLKANDWQIIED